MAGCKLETTLWLQRPGMGKCLSLPARQSLEFRLLSYESFLSRGRFPCFPTDADDTVDVGDVNLGDSLVIYVSLGDPVAFPRRKHQMYPLVIKAVEDVKRLYLASSRSHSVFLYISYSCSFDDTQFYTELMTSKKRSFKGKQAAALGRTLFDIMAVCDIMLTPLLLDAHLDDSDRDEETKSSSPDFATPPRPPVNSANRNLTTPRSAGGGARKQPSHGRNHTASPNLSSSPQLSRDTRDRDFYGYPHSYLCRSSNYWTSHLAGEWARLELTLSSRVPLLTRGKQLFRGSLATAHSLGRRPHFVFCGRLDFAPHRDVLGRPTQKMSVDRASAALMLLPHLNADQAKLLAPMPSGPGKILYLLRELERRPTYKLEVSTGQGRGEAGKGKVKGKEEKAPAQSRPFAPLRVKDWSNDKIVGDALIQLVSAPDNVPSPEELRFAHYNQSQGQGQGQGLGDAEAGAGADLSKPVTLLLPSGAVYRGLVDRDGRFSGEGEYVTSGYDVCSGTWVDGKLHGPQCRIEYATGDVYSGHVAANKRHGFGFYRKADGSFYEGDWVRGVREGHGRSFDLHCNYTYVGAFVDGLPQGAGMITYENGNSFIGLFQDGKRHGQGKLVRQRRVRDLSPGAPKPYVEREDIIDVFEGTWKNGELVVP